MDVNETWRLRPQGLALVRGDFSGHLTKADAAHVLNLLHYYYFKDKRLVEQVCGVEGGWRRACSSGDFKGKVMGRTWGDCWVIIS